ncbi:MAG TPA: DUF5946 family protein [Thermoleophilaceae bacterium]|nr:DUF5946 family protein [Thermoleophilaceae bacterium]
MSAQGAGALCRTRLRPGERARRPALRPARRVASAPRRLTAEPLSRCPGCGLVHPEREGPTHPYLVASPGCWAMYGEVLAREYGDPAYFRVHQLTVDTYAVQHPGRRERRTIQSLGLHLSSLCLVVERGGDPTAGPRFHRRLAGRAGFDWLEPPEPRGRLTVADVRGAGDPGEHAAAVEAWARDVWAAWAPTMRPSVAGSNAGSGGPSSEER